MLNLISTWRRERATIQELARLSDRELEDIGFGRADVKSVVRQTRIAGASGSEGLTVMAPSWGSHLRRAVTQ